MSSASSSSLSLSEFDRDSTPSSLSSATDTEGGVSQLVSNFVYLPSKPESTVLKALFDEHAKTGYLGLCVQSGEGPQMPPSFQDWEKERIIPKGCTETIDVFISPPGEVLGQDQASLAYVSTTHPEVSKHLLAFSVAGFRAVLCLALPYDCFAFIIEQPSVVFPPLSQTPGFSVNGQDSSGNIPTLKEWQNLWSAWDLITLRMTPKEMLHQRPIELRHKPLFYIGHIPTFLDMLLHKSVGGGATEPQYFWNIFERGIDPHVDDPNHCHNHSEVPEKDEDWPTLDTVIEFRDRVRVRLAKLYDDLKSGKRALTRNIARTLVMTFEHEAFHVETLLYIIIRRAGSGTLPPAGITPPAWEVLQQQWNTYPPLASQTVVVGPATITLGQVDSEGDDSREGVATDVDGHIFGWDNENPERQYEVKAFRAAWRPITNGEYESFWLINDKLEESKPTSWVEVDGEMKVITLYGPVPMRIAQDWPLLASYDQLSNYARATGGRLPTEPELRLFLDTYDVGYEGGANTGFRNWHPIPPTMGLDENGGKGTNGGVWEWTSTLFDGHDGLSPTKLFTGYSTDFFDAKHHVVLGSSYATLPRLERRTLRNFYQHNYPYAWVAGRVVYDILE